jgi:hypothetical protein
MPFDESGDLTDREPGPARVLVAPSTSSDAW